MANVITLDGLPEEVALPIKELVRSLKEEARKHPPSAAGRQPLAGRLSHIGIEATDQEIDSARREAWANFPREFPDPS